MATIILLSYQRARFLPAALKSALGQTYQNVEIVVADDGSTDGSLEIARDFQKVNPQLRVVTHPGRENRGIAATTNLAVEESKGSYLWFFSCDDVLLPNAVAGHLEIMRKDDQIGLVAGYGYFINSEGRRISGLKGRNLALLADPLFFFLQGFPVIGTSLMVHRERYMQVHPQEEMICSDWEALARLVAVTEVGFQRAPVVQYRLHGGNISRGISKAEAANRGLEVMSSLRETRNSVGKLAVPRYQALIELRLADLHLVLGSTEQAECHLETALELWPALVQEPRAVGRWLAPRLDPKLVTQGEKIPFADWFRFRLERHLGRPATRSIWRHAQAVRSRALAVNSLAKGRRVAAGRHMIDGVRKDPLFIFELLPRWARYKT